jgi:serine/threonine protein phosphatase PrpC
MACVSVKIHAQQTPQSQHCTEYRPSIAFFSPSGIAPLFLLLACDGVFDTMDNTIVGSIAHKVTQSLCPPALIHCSAQFSTTARTITPPNAES